MRLTRRFSLVTTTMIGLAALPVLADTPLLTPQKPIVIPGGPGAFDWMLVDGRSQRVFATHKGTRTLAIVDLKTDTAIAPVTVGTAQGVAIDRRDNKIFLGDDEEKKSLFWTTRH